MIKIGIIGLGNIAAKAYLPVLSSRTGFEFHLCSRNESRLKEMSAAYRISNVHTHLDSLLNAGINGAFVHTATDSHFEIIKKLLETDISVFADKPITMEYKLSRQLTELAEARKLFFMTGFNRRYAPVYQHLKEIPDPTLIIMQKNRKSLPDEVRRFILDDFIHVVDTLRFLFPYPIDDMSVQGIKKQAKLYQVVIQLISNTGAVAIGIMNRDGNVTEEKLEVMSAAMKATALNVSQLVIEKSDASAAIRANDWESTLHKRGFEQMTDYFLRAVATKDFTGYSSRDALITHEICEQIVEKLELQ